MAEILINKPEYSEEKGWDVVSTTISINGKIQQLRFKISEGPLAKGSDPFLAAVLFPAMKLAQPLRISDYLSPKLLAATHTIQDIFHRWFRDFGKIEIQATPGPSEAVSNAKDVGAFFSGGVDSFYTLLKHQDEITKVIFVHGLDIKLNNNSYRLKVSNEVRSIAKELGKQIVEVETNVHEFADQYDYNGSLLPSIGLILSAQFKKIYIPSNVSYDYASPDSSHPLLDPLWSTESLTFVHDGCEASRNEKLVQISQSDIALRSLRVCLQNPEDSYNCCHCEKCLRTMIGLQAVGVLDRSPTFKKKLDIEAVSRIKLRDQLLPFAEENLKFLERSGDNTGLLEALRSCVRNYKHRKMAILMQNNFGGFLFSEHGLRFVRGKRNMLFGSLWRHENEWMMRELIKEMLKKVDQRMFFGLFKRLYDTV